MSIKKLIKLLNTFQIKEVYFGAEGFQLVSVDELNNAQIGYSIKPDVEAPAARRWNNVYGYNIAIVSNKINGTVWSVRIYKIP